MITRSDRTNDVTPASLDHRGEDEGPYVSPSRLARHWGVHINTVYRDIRKGALRAQRLPGGQWRISLAEARRYGRPEE